MIHLLMPSTQIPSFYPVLDRVEHVLSPDGLLSVVDFYTAGKQPSLHEKVGFLYLFWSVNSCELGDWGH